MAKINQVIREKKTKILFVLLEHFQFGLLKITTERFFSTLVVDIILCFSRNFNGLFKSRTITYGSVPYGPLTGVRAFLINMNDQGLGTT